MSFMLRFHRYLFIINTLRMKRHYPSGFYLARTSVRVVRTLGTILTAFVKFATIGHVFKVRFDVYIVAG
jgi:hypothetical protein